MRLEGYAAKHNALICDWSDTWSPEAAERGWKCLAVFSNPEDCEPDMLLVQSPSWPNYQVRNMSTGIKTGTMLTEKQVKDWIKARAASGKNAGKYIVKNENTLCYRQDGSHFVGVLAGSVLRGGHNPLYGPVCIAPTDTVRPATLADFEFFNVCPIGHIA